MREDRAPLREVEGEVWAMLGAAVWLAAHSATHRHWSIEDAQRLFAVPVDLQQICIWHDGRRPVALLTWAHLSPEVEAMYRARAGKLRPEHWRSGDRLWAIDFIAPFGRVAECRHLVQQIAGNQVMHWRRLRPNRVTYGHHLRGARHD